jgi:hypothetical protein
MSNPSSLGWNKIVSVVEQESPKKSRTNNKKM